MTFFCEMVQKSPMFYSYSYFKFDFDEYALLLAEPY